MTESSSTNIYTSNFQCHQHKITEFSIDLGDNATIERICGKTECNGHQSEAICDPIDPDTSSALVALF